MKNIETLSSFEELSAKLGVKVDAIVKELYFAIQSQVEFYKDDAFANPRTLKTVNSSSLVSQAIKDYFEVLDKKMDFEIDLDCPFFKVLKGYAFSRIIDMVISIKSEGNKIFTEIDYQKQKVQYSLL